MVLRLDMSKYKKSAINSRFITPEDEDEAQPFLVDGNFRTNQRIKESIKQ